jgi:four helix bundle protein
MFAFQGTEVYLKSKFFYLECKKILSQIKADKTVADQLRRASLSIPLNIAEGSGKFSNPDRKNFYIVARASLFESVAILDILHEEELITEFEFKSIESTGEEISKMLYRMIKNLE